MIFEMSRAVLIQAHQMYSTNIGVALEEGEGEKVQFYTEMVEDLNLAIRALEVMGVAIEQDEQAQEDILAPVEENPDL